VGIIRTTQELEDVLKQIKNLKSQIKLMGVSDSSKVYNSNLIEFMEFKNMLDICEEVVFSALQRKSSCGAHFMEQN
jgi:succinate dehydrogenase / fumarate reductase flavoprotein subunit